MINRWIVETINPLRYSKHSESLETGTGRYLVKVEAWNRIVYPIGVQAAVHLGGFSGLNRGLQSSRRVPRGIAVGTRSSFHYVRPLQPEECPAAVVRVASLSVWKQQRPLYVRTIWTIIRSSFFSLSLFYPYFFLPWIPRYDSVTSSRIVWFFHWIDLTFNDDSRIALREICICIVEAARNNVEKIFERRVSVATSVVSLARDGRGKK